MPGLLGAIGGCPPAQSTHRCCCCCAPCLCAGFIAAPPASAPASPAAAALPLQVVAHASETVNVVDTCVGTELLRSMLPHLLEQLELTQKSLSAYLGA